MMRRRRYVTKKRLREQLADARDQAALANQEACLLRIELAMDRGATLSEATSAERQRLLLRSESS